MSSNQTVEPIPPPSPLEMIRNAIVFMAVVVGGFVVRELQAILTPLVIAIFMLLLIDAFSLAVERRWQWGRAALAVRWRSRLIPISP